MAGALDLLEVHDGAPVVRIEGLRANVPGSEEARAAAETQVARAGISVSMDTRSQAKLSNAMMRVDIGHCELHVGNEQLGILCLNADQAHVHDNLIQADDKAGPMQQGIVVAGGLAGQVHIERNEVLGAVAGIAVAVSDEAGKDDPALSAERVHLAHNRVRVELTESHRVSNRFGLMVGNAQAVELFHNQVQAAGKVAQELGLHGIRLHGLFGSHLVARDNHVDGAAVGVRFDPIKLPRKKPLWLFAGNNVSFSDEIYRRLIPIRLDANRPDPENRPTALYKHYPLAAWLMSARRDLVWACHTLIQNWIAKGKIMGSGTLASFETWAGVMTGIVEAAGLNGALSTIGNYKATSNDDAGEENSFVQWWHDRWKYDRVGPGEMVQTMTTPGTDGGLTGVSPMIAALGLDSRNDGTLVRSLGYYVKRQVIGKTARLADGTLVKAVKAAVNPARYQLVPVAATDV